MALGHLSAVSLLLGVAGVCLYPVTRTTSAKPRILITMLGAVAAGLFLLPSWRIGPLDLPLACLAAVAIGGTPWRGRDWPLAVIPDHEGDNLMGCLGFFGIAGVAAHLSQEDRTFILYALLLVGVAVSLTAYYQLYLRARSGDWKAVIRDTRLQGTIANPVFLGGLLAMSIVLALSLRMYWAVGVMLPPLLFTRSRAAYLGLAVGGGIVLGWMWTAAVLVIGAVTFFLNPQKLRSLRVDLAHDLRIGRGKLYRDVALAIARNPWLGYGQNAWHTHSGPSFLALDSGKQHKSPHNVWLYYAHAWGVPGAVAFVWVASTAILGAPQTVLPALVAGLVWEQFLWPFYGPANMFYLLLGLGITS